MLWLLTGAALALPQPILGTSGPAWVGPLPPEDGRSLVAVVDPDWAHWSLRSLSGTVASAPGREPSGPWMGRSSIRTSRRLAIGWTARSFWSATASLGARHEFGYDDDGRLDAVVWGTSAWVCAMTMPAESSSLSGPGQRQLSLSWGTGLSWTDEMGRSTTLRTQDAGPMRTVTLTDPVGRTVATQYRQRDGEWTLTGWVDPRGLGRLGWGRTGAGWTSRHPAVGSIVSRSRWTGPFGASRCLRAIAGSGSAAPKEVQRIVDLRVGSHAGSATRPVGSSPCRPRGG